MWPEPAPDEHEPRQRGLLGVNEPQPDPDQPQEPPAKRESLADLRRWTAELRSRVRYG